MRLSRGLWGGAAILVLSGCTVTAPGTPPADGGDPAAAGGPGIQLDCAGLVDLDVLAEAFAGGIAPVALTFDGAGNYYALSQIGLAQAGALRCEWSDGGADGPERYLTVSVLPRATDAWATQSAAVALFQPQEDAHGDASWHSCTDSAGYSACRIDVLAGDRWLSAVLGGLTSADAASAVIEAALGSVAAATDRDIPAAATPATCDDLASADLVGTTIGGAVERVELETPVQPVIFHAGFLAAGGTFCSWRNGLGSSSALTADLGFLPGGAAAWDAYWADEPRDRVDRAPVPDLGDAAYAGCVADIHCFAAVRAGDDWFEVTVNDEAVPDERERAIELARAVLESR